MDQSGDSGEMCVCACVRVCCAGGWVGGWVCDSVWAPTVGTGRGNETVLGDCVPKAHQGVNFTHFGIRIAIGAKPNLGHTKMLGVNSDGYLRTAHILGHVCEISLLHTSSASF
jgi:hypothetical protein